MMSNCNNEKVLLNGLDNPNEAVRYWAAIGLYNLDRIVNDNAIPILQRKLQEDSIINVSIAAGRALLKIGFKKQNIITKLAEGLSSKNEWTRLQTALVIDDFSFAALNLEKKSKELIKNDPNKYVVRVLNHALNELNGTKKKVR